MSQRLHTLAVLKIEGAKNGRIDAEACGHFLRPVKPFLNNSVYFLSAIIPYPEDPLTIPTFLKTDTWRHLKWPGGWQWQNDGNVVLCPPLHGINNLSDIVFNVRGITIKE